MEDATVTWLGHSSALVELDGVRLLTDPVFHRRVAHLRRTAPAVGRLPPVDAVLLSHRHADHFHARSLARAGRSTLVLAPPRTARELRLRLYANASAVREGDELPVGSVTVHVTEAAHGRAEAVGFVVEGSRRIYFPGDTDLFPGMAGLGPLDLALVPIWGWGPALGAGHLDPQRAAEALALLSPRIAVPIHWGTYAPAHLLLRRRPHWLESPVERFLEAAAAQAPGVEVRVLSPGGSTAV